MASEDNLDSDIKALLEWNPPSDGKLFLGSVFGALVCALLSVALKAVGASWFDLDRTQQCIVFAGTFIALGRMADSGHFPNVAHVALAVKALALASSRRR